MSTAASSPSVSEAVIPSRSVHSMQISPIFVLFQSKYAQWTSEWGKTKFSATWPWGPDKGINGKRSMNMRNIRADIMLFGNIALLLVCSNYCDGLDAKG
ncbi:hypothetical protein RIF29_10838 [Crotalaria pallida]|uniref:Uncharacterized protein n=1 Tax=Crotalaria pallida TaxID=3830 RepID=A0AAN9IIK8_CROPI